MAGLTAFLVVIIGLGVAIGIYCMKLHKELNRVELLEGSKGSD